MTQLHPVCWFSVWSCWVPLFRTADSLTSVLLAAQMLTVKLLSSISNFRYNGDFDTHPSDLTLSISATETAQNFKNFLCFDCCVDHVINSFSVMFFSNLRIHKTVETCIALCWFGPSVFFCVRCQFCREYSTFHFHFLLLIHAVNVELSRQLQTTRPLCPPMKNKLL